MSMLTRSIRGLRALSVCRRGATVMEFALTAPAVVIIAIGVIEVGAMLFVNTLMEGALREASRFGITGNVPPGVTREQAIRDIIAQHTIGVVDMDTVDITYKVYPSFEQIGGAEPFTDVNTNGTWDEGEPYDDINENSEWDSDMGKEGLGDANEIVRYEIGYDWPLLTPLLSKAVSESGALRLHTTVTVRNEPYDHT